MDNEFNYSKDNAEELTPVKSEYTEKTRGEEAATVGNGKKIPKTPDLPTVSCRTCAEYREYMSGTPDDNSSLKHNPVPADGLSLMGLGQKTDEEILRIVNDMAKVPRKSDIRVMYACGYGFSWGQLCVVAQFCGFHLDNPGVQSPHYSIPGEKDKLITERVEKGGTGDTIYIEHGRPLNKEVHWKLAQRTVDGIGTLLDTADHKPISKVEKSKIIDELLWYAVRHYLEIKRTGGFSVVYKPTEEQRII